jgi:hypothetical protein
MSIRTIEDHLREGRLSVTVMDDGSGVLLDSEKEALFNLNATGLFIIERIRAGCGSVEAVADELARAFRIEHRRARSDAERFLSELEATL